MVVDAIETGGLLDVSELSVEGVYGMANASIVVDDGAVIIADRDITMTAHATSSATNTTSGRYLALSFASASASVSLERKRIL